MLQCVLVFVLLFSVTLNATQQPKAHMLALCSTRDGAYRIFVVETNQAPGTPQRTFIAIKDEQGNFVATHYGSAAPGESLKYGKVKYVDTKTAGGQFLLDAPSNTIQGFQVNATIWVNGKEDHLHDGNMQCSAYNRQLPGRLVNSANERDSDGKITTNHESRAGTHLWRRQSSRRLFARDTTA